MRKTKNKGKTQSRIESTKSTLKKKILEVYKQKACNITATCEAVNIDRKTFYNYKKDDTEFSEAIDGIEEGLIDFAESMLLRNIRAGKEASIFFFLKCKGKKRGYVERQETVDLPSGDAEVLIK